MPEMPIQLLRGDKVNSDTDYADALPENVSGVVKDILGASGYMLQQPGISQFGTGSGIDRAGLWNERQSDHFRVSGTDLISVSSSGVSTVLGTISGSNLAAMPYSFTNQGIVTDGKYWLYNPTDGFRQVTDPDLGSPIDCVWVDEYMFFTDGEYIYHTDAGDDESIDPLKFATSEFSPDPTLGVAITQDDKVAVFNRYTTEFFVNQAQENFAFTRLPARAIKAGIVGTFCKVEIDGVFYILGGAKEASVSFYALGTGYVESIASREVARIVGQYTESELSQVLLETRTVDNYPYLIAHLPNHTLLFNFKVAKLSGVEQAWSILKSDVEGDTPWRAINGLFDPRVAKWVYGDKQDDKLGYLDMSVATHYGELAECIIYTPFIYLEEMSIDELDIQTIPGFTATDDAQVFVSLTYQGVTWSMEKTMNYGAPSAYSSRFIIYRLGYVDNYFAMKFRWVCTSRMAFSLAKIKYG